jgi:LacI family transcriptional regulator
MVTMDDIARHAGVSRTTVSFVLNKWNGPTGRISEETRRRVLLSASVLNYQTNELAKSVVTGKNRVLGVLTSPDMHNAFQVLTGAIEVAEQNNYLLKLLHLSYNTIDESVISRCLQWRLAGVLVFGLSDEVHRYIHDEFERIKMPLAIVDSAPSLFRWGAWGCSDDAQGMLFAVSHLTDLGHRRIAFMGGEACALSEWRERVFREAMSAKGLVVPTDWVQRSSWVTNIPTIEAVARELLTSSHNGDRPTAIVCASDLIALIVQRIARSLGFQLPSDLSIMGYGDHQLARFADPPLTSVKQSFHALGGIATQRLITLAENKAEKREIEGETIVEQANSFMLPTSLVIRSSTAPPSM